MSKDELRPPAIFRNQRLRFLQFFSVTSLTSVLSLVKAFLQQHKKLYRRGHREEPTLDRHSYFAVATDAALRISSGQETVPMRNA